MEPNALSARSLFFRRLADDEDIRTRIDEIFVVLSTALLDGGKILFAGNGGSAADAQHLAAEYVGSGFASVALTTDSSVLTALGNDFGFERAFAGSVRALGKPGDVLVVHSTSGNSPNVVEAVEEAKERKIVTVGLTAKGGGAVAKIVDLGIVIPTEDTALAQEAHLAIGHIVYEGIRRLRS